jgi:hypothetical protein
MFVNDVNESIQSPCKEKLLNALLAERNLGRGY